MLMHLSKEPERPTAIDPAIPAEVEAVILSALDKDPSKRPTARGLMEAFVEAAGSARRARGAAD
jgi:serine/threonine protein kinase